MQAKYPRSEVIEEELKPTQHREHRTLFRYIPWRWVAGASIISLLVGVALTIIVQQLQSDARPAFSPVLPAVRPPILDDSPIPWGFSERVDDIVYSGRLMAVVKPSNLRLYRDDVLIEVLDTGIFTSRQARALAFRRDGARLALLDVQVSTETNLPEALLRIWDTASGDLFTTHMAHQGMGLNPSYWSGAVAYAPDGRLIATGAGDGTITLWDAETLELQTTISTLAAGTSALAFSQDGTRLTAILSHGYYSSPSRWSAEATVWDIRHLADPQPVTSVSLDALNVQGAILNADGRYVAYVVTDHTTQTDTIHIHDLVEGREAGALSFAPDVRIHRLALSPEGDELVYDVSRITVSEADSTSVTQHELRGIWWWLTDGVFYAQDLAVPRSIGTVGASHLHLWFKGDMRVDYVAQDSRTLLRWSLAVNRVSAIGL